MSSFPRKLRLSKNDQYQAVYQANKKKATANLVFYFKNNTLSYARLGLGVSKRVVRHAVNRNRIKRINREHFRFRQERLTNFDFVIVARKGIQNIADEELFKCLGQEWDYFLNTFVNS